MEDLKKFNLTHTLSSIATILSVISAIVYVTIFAGTLDKRISVVENQQQDVQSRITIMREDINTMDAYQTNDQKQFHDDVNVQLAQMGNRIEKIYSILLDAKKHETI